MNDKNDVALVRNAASAKQVKKAEKSERRGRFKELNDLRVVLNTREGRRYIWGLITASNIYGNLFDNSGSRTYFNIGVREMGLNILADVMESAPEMYLKMQTEQKEDELKLRELNEQGEQKDED